VKERLQQTASGVRVEAELPWLKLPVVDVQVKNGDLHFDRRGGAHLIPTDPQQSGRAYPVVVPTALAVTFQFISDALGAFSFRGLLDHDRAWRRAGQHANDFGVTLMEIIEEEARWALPQKEYMRAAKKLTKFDARWFYDDPEKGGQKRKTLFYSTLAGLKL